LISDARILKTPTPLSSIREEVFCEFEIQGQIFIAWEPFGDNSRYWIGPEPTAFCEQLATVRKAFATS